MYKQKYLFIFYKYYYLYKQYVVGEIEIENTLAVRSAERGRHCSRLLIVFVRLFDGSALQLIS